MDVRPIHVIIFDHADGREIRKARDAVRVARFERMFRARGLKDVHAIGCHKHCPCGGRLDRGEIKWGESL